jgi:hypothetical protein
MKFGGTVCCCLPLTLKWRKLSGVFLHEIRGKNHVTLSIKYEYMNGTKKYSVIKLLVARKVISEVITVVPPENGNVFVQKPRIKNRWCGNPVTQFGEIGYKWMIRDVWPRRLAQSVGGDQKLQTYSGGACWNLSWNTSNPHDSFFRVFLSYPQPFQVNATIVP